MADTHLARDAKQTSDLIPAGTDAAGPVARGFALAGSLACLIPLAAAFGSPLHDSVVLALAVTLGLALTFPGAGLQLLCVLVPMSATIGGVTDSPWEGTRLAQAFTFAFLSGWAGRVALTGAFAVPQNVAGPALLMLAVPAGSLLVQLGAAWGDASAMSALGAAAAPSRLLAHPVELSPFNATVTWVLGVLVFAAAAAAVGNNPQRTRVTVATLALALTAAALLNVQRFAEAVLGAGAPARALWEYLTWMRVNVHYADVNAAGTVFALLTLLLVGLARSSGRAGAGWALAITVSLAALVLAGSRTAVAALLLGLPVGAAWELRHHISRRLGVAAAALFAIAITGAALMLWSSPRYLANADPATALSTRQELLLRGTRMVGDAPLFGVGVGRFYWRSDQYASRDSPFGRENAHNDFMQIAAELGLFGFGAFLWLLYRAAHSGRHRWEPRPLRVWTATALVVYLLTSAGGHPLIVFDSALPFWLVLGLVAGAGGPGPAGSRRAQRVAAAALIVLLVSLPVRIFAGRRFTGGPSYTWQVDGEIRFRDVGTTDTLVLRSPLQGLVIPLRITTGEAGNSEARVDIRVDDQFVNRVVARADVWAPVRIVLPRAEGVGYRRVTLSISEPPRGTRLLVGRPALF